MDIQAPVEGRSSVLAIEGPQDLLAPRMVALELGHVDHITADRHPFQMLLFRLLLQLCQGHGREFIISWTLE